MPFDAADVAAFFDEDMPGYAIGTFSFGDVDGLFSNNYADALGFSGTSPVFVCSKTDAASVAQGDAVVIGGINYTISRIEPDAGMTRLVLQEA